MGRIQKKKDPAKKKIKPNDVNSAGGEAAASGVSEAVVSRPAPAIRKSAAADRSKAVSGQPSFLQKSVQFYREVKIELKKVTWPSRKQTMGSTVVVVILVIIISLFLGLVDLGLSSLMRAVLP